MGSRIRRLREERGMKQSALAAALQISASYLNQLEHNQRPLTVPILLRLTAAFGVEAHYFSDDDEAHLLSELRTMSALLPQEPALSTLDLRMLAAEVPEAGRALLALFRRYRDAAERLEVLGEQMGDHERVLHENLAPMPYEEVRDYFYAQHNYVAALESAAEQLVNEAELLPGAMSEGLAQRLADKHRVKVMFDDGDEARRLRRFEPRGRTLYLARHLHPGQRAFQMATQLALLEHRGLLEQLAADAPLSSDDARVLARIGLANYFAGAVLCPYTKLLTHAEALSYDIDRLTSVFGVGFETICHRLSTLQRPDAPGVPFFFVRVDRAGNISKRQSATDFHFARFGGTCPLWNVYEAFAQPGRVLVQLAQMPDGRTYLWIARTVSSQRAAYRTRAKEFAVGLGCDVRHASKLIYAKGLDLSDPNSATQIGVGCKVCERKGCEQRAFPPLGRPLAIDEHESRVAPYHAV